MDPALQPGGGHEVDSRDPPWAHVAWDWLPVPCPADKPLAGGSLGGRSQGQEVPGEGGPDLEG